MSVAAMSWAIGQDFADKPGLPKAHAVDKLLLILLADHANEAGQCWPSQERLAALCLCSIDSVQRAIVRLADRGLIVKSGRGKSGGGRTSDMFLLVMAKRGSLEAVNALECATEQRTLNRKMRSNVKPQNAVFKHRKMRYEPKYREPKKDTLLFSAEYEAARASPRKSVSAISKLIEGKREPAIAPGLLADAEGFGLDAGALAARAIADTPKQVDRAFKLLCERAIADRLPGLSRTVIAAALSRDLDARRTVFELLTMAEASRT